MRNADILGWCAYCKDPIYRDQEYQVEGSMIFHPECLAQKNRYGEFLSDDSEDGSDDCNIGELE